MRTNDLDQAIQKHYSQAARKVLDQKGKASCCSSSAACCCDLSVEPSNDAMALYDREQLAEITADAANASLGCGNPVLLAELHPGETVLDLGSGGGIDVFLAAKAVGPTGFVIGLDMTDDMLELAERNRAEAGANNTRFVKGKMENIPLEDASVDVVISNCVINLSSDKSAVLEEALRVLRPGGRLAVSDTVFTGDVPDQVRSDEQLWACCVGGALHVDEYKDRLSAAGFEDVTIVITGQFEEAGITVANASVRASKPV